MDCSGIPCSVTPLTHFKDILNPFDPVNDAQPLINRTVEFSATDHARMDKILFGFTEGTGGHTQIAYITGFNIYFPQTLPCIYLLSATAPNPAVFTSAVGSGTFNVTGCTGAWTATSSTPGWLTTTSSGTAAGPGAYTVAANASYSQRTGTISVGPSSGQSFTVTQAGQACPTVVINPASPLSNGTVNTAYGPVTFTKTASAVTDIWSWSANAGSTLPAGLTLSSGGVLNGTPTTAGTYNFTVQATGTCSGSKAYSITIGTAPFYCTSGGTTITNPTGLTRIHTFRTAGTLFSLSSCTGAGSVRVQAIGGGGRGGDATNNPAYCGGGGGGAYAESTFVLDLGTTPVSYPVVVGAGGTTTAAGGDSSVATTAVVAKGGGSVANNSATGASGGSASTGTITYIGGNGANASGTSSGGGGGGAGSNGNGNNASGTTGGTARTVNGGSGGAGSGSSNDGGNGNNYGGGGGGGRAGGNTDHPGGHGASGIVIISYPEVHTPY